MRYNGRKPGPDGGSTDDIVSVAKRIQFNLLTRADRLCNNGRFADASVLIESARTAGDIVMMYEGEEGTFSDGEED